MMMCCNKRVCVCVYCKELVENIMCYDFRATRAFPPVALFKSLCQGNHYLQRCKSLLFCQLDVCCVTVIFLKMQFHLLAFIDIERCGKVLL